MKNIFNNILIILFFALNQLLTAQTPVAPSGSGTSGDPYQIANWQNLYWISQNSAQWNKYYIQTADIDFSTASPAINTWDGGKGWRPIGSSSTHFTGSYNGNNKTISGLYIARSGFSDIGLFGYASGSCAISNLGVQNVNITGSGYVGGLVGRLESGTISNCFSTGNVYVNVNYNGGLVGYSSATITESYSTVVLHNTGNSSSSGGFVGFTSSGTAISNCYARGNVTATSNVGGFAGYANQGTITNCYSTGSITASSSYGGFAGTGWTATINSCFWDNQTSGQSSSWGATGKTTAQMKTQSTFTGWDFTNIWEIVGGDGANYPRLKDNPDPALPVELSSLNAECRMNNVELRWRTETEVNNYGFEIERKYLTSTSLSVTNWEKIGFIKGNGNSNSPKDYSFTDVNPPSGKLKYRLKQIDTDGSFSYSQEIEIEIGVPKEFKLHQNYPNPFNPTTKIEYQLPYNSDVRIELYSITGERVAMLVNQYQEAGYYTIEVNALKLNLTSGVFFYRMITDNFIQVRKLLIMK